MVGGLLVQTWKVVDYEKKKCCEAESERSNRQSAPEGKSWFSSIDPKRRDIAGCEMSSWWVQCKSSQTATWGWRRDKRRNLRVYKVRHQGQLTILVAALSEAWAGAQLGEAIALYTYWIQLSYQTEHE